MLRFLQLTHLAYYTTVLCGFCKKSEFKIAMNRQHEKACSKMGLKANFTFDFTAVLKLDPTTICYQEYTTGTTDLYLE